jgi:hypothetical protein
LNDDDEIDSYQTLPLLVDHALWKLVSTFSKRQKNEKENVFFSFFFFFFFFLRFFTVWKIRFVAQATSTNGSTAWSHWRCCHCCYCDDSTHIYSQMPNRQYLAQIDLNPI